MAVIFGTIGGSTWTPVICHDDFSGSIGDIFKPYSDHSDYDNYSDHSDYSDAAERKRRRLEAMKSEAESQVRELSGYKSNIVNPELSSQTLKQQTAMRVSESDMDVDARAKINRQIEHDQMVETSELKSELEVVDDLLSKISRIERENCSMNAIEAINQFVDAMLDSGKEFENIKAEAEHQHKAVEECIARFREDMSRLKSKDIRDSGLRELLQKQIAILEEMLKTIDRKLESIRFIKEYGDSFNIVVFGNVKAGKSYAGNFIMGNVIRNLGIQTSYDKIPRPTVKVIDIRHDQTGVEAFFVDPNEVIQLFRLGGMVWIDTPGIGSITWENEILVKDFVENADLIVYMHNSDAAGTKWDFVQVKALYGKHKRFLFLLTQSDTDYEDYDDDGNIIAVLAPKNDADRKSMEDYICNTLIESGINDFNRESEILTISTKLAIEGLKTNDEAMFDASNMKSFLEVLVSITRSEAAKIKLATPARRINAMVDDIIKELRKAQAKLSEHMKLLSDARERLTERSKFIHLNIELIHQIMMLGRIYEMRDNADERIESAIHDLEGLKKRC